MVMMKRFSAVFLVLALTSTLVVSRQLPAGATPEDEIEEALSAYESQLKPLVGAIGELQVVQSDHLETRGRVEIA